MTESIERFASVLDQVYAAAVDPLAWPQALAMSSEWLGAPRALLFTPYIGPGDGGFFYAYGVSSEDMAIWGSKYVGVDFWTQRVHDRKLDFEGSVVLDSDLSSRRELLASDYYREHLTRMQMAWLMVGVVLAPRDGSLPVVACSLYRGIADTGFDEGARQRMALLLPHLSRALGVMYKLREAELRATAHELALDALGCAVVLLDGLGDVVQANRAAEKIWRTADGLSLQDQRLQVFDGPSQRAWQTSLRATLASGGAGRVAHFAEALSVPRTSGGAAYLLQLSRLPETSRYGTVHSGAKVIVFITDGERSSRVSLELLSRTYGLSNAEARTAQALCDGGRLSITAARLGLSVNTVKTRWRCPICRAPWP